MTRSRIGLSAIAVRVTGIVLALYMIKNLASTIYVIGTQPETGNAAIIIAAILGIFGVALFMIFFPASIAGKLLPPMRDEGSSALTEGDIERLACSLIGLYFFVQAFLDLSYMLTLWQWTEIFGYGWNWSPEYIASAVRIIGQLIVAIWFLFGASGLVKLIRHARGAKPFQRANQQ